MSELTPNNLVIASNDLQNFEIPRLTPHLTPTYKGAFRAEFHPLYRVALRAEFSMFYLRFRFDSKTIV